MPYRLFDRDRELPFWEQPLQRAAFTGQAVSAVERRLVRSDSTSLDVLVSAEPLFDQQGKPRGAIAAIADISEMVMGRMHELLSRGMWQSVSLNVLVLAVLEPYRNSRNDNVLIAGPDVALPANVATTLGMALHELATNAAKYGALSVSAGRVEISWQTGDDAGTKRLEIAWIERNGPRI